MPRGVRDISNRSAGVRLTRTGVSATGVASVILVKAEKSDDAETALNNGGVRTDTPDPPLKGAVTMVVLTLPPRTEGPLNVMTSPQSEFSSSVNCGSTGGGGGKLARSPRIALPLAIEGML